MKKLGITKEEIRSFVLTLIATLAGVFIAISMTNSEIQKKEKEDTIKLLKTANVIINGAKSYSQNLSNFISKIEADTSYNTKLKINSLKAKNPIPYPDKLEGIITNEIVSKNISEFAIRKIYMELFNLKKLAEYSTINRYEQTLMEFTVLIECEIQYQKGELNLYELIQSVNKKQREIAEQYADSSVFELNTDEFSQSK